MHVEKCTLDRDQTMTLLTPGFFRLKKFDEKSAPKVASASRYGRVGAARLRGIGLAARFVVIP